MSKWLLRLLGLRECRVCDKWTRPSIIFGNICSQECLTKEMK